jgi:hypothetical protein
MDPAARLNSVLKAARDVASMDRNAGVRPADPGALRKRHPTIADRRRAATTPALRSFNVCELSVTGGRPEGP